MISLGNRAHIFAHPSLKEKLTWCFGTVLGCGPAVSLELSGRPEPVLAFRFPGGGSLSIEFVADALDEKQMRRGAWLEVKAEDPSALKEKILEAGLVEVKHPGHSFYFVAPGGQVFTVISAREP
jgi:hypothetical protein